MVEIDHLRGMGKDGVEIEAYMSEKEGFGEVEAH